MSTDVSDTIRITARFDNSRIEREMIVNEIGVFAKRGNHEEFMYMYTWAEQGDVIPPKTSAYVYRDYDFNTTISKNSQIIIQYNATDLVYATVPELKVTERKLQTNIDNHIRDAARHVSDQERTRWNGKADLSHRHKVADIDGLPEKIDEFTRSKAEKVDLTGHINNRNNPHNVTKAQVGLGNVDNVRQASYTDHEATKINVNEQEQRLSLLEEMVLQNRFYVPIKAEDNDDVLLGDENNNLVVADWKYQVVEREE